MTDVPEMSAEPTPVSLMTTRTFATLESWAKSIAATQPEPALASPSSQPNQESLHPLYLPTSDARCDKMHCVVL